MSDVVKSPLISDLPTIVFSYNRGALLWNLYQSMQMTGFPTHRLTIRDDGSQDRLTIEVLDRLEDSGVDVRRRRHKESSNQHHGGLYNNMNEALRELREASEPCAVFLQDDMQFLHFDDRFLTALVGQLNSIDTASSITFQFFKFLQGSSFGWRQDLGLFENLGLSLPDTGLISVSRLSELGFRYSTTERGNSLAVAGARSSFCSPVPFVAHVPWPGRARAPADPACPKTPLRVGPPASV